MQKTQEKYLLGEQVYSLYAAIKRDDINSFLNIIKQNPKFLYFNNKKKENLLFYSISSGSENISKYLIEQNSDFLFSLNKYNQTPFSKLINYNNINSLDLFFKLVSPVNISKLLKNDKFLIQQAISKLDDSGWKLFSNYTKFVWSELDLNQSNEKNENIAHTIAYYNKDYCLEILDNCKEDIYNQGTLNFGDTPLLLAAKYSNTKIVNYYLSKSNLTHTSMLGNNVLHYAAINNDSETLKTFLSLNKINPIEKNIYMDSPLLNTITYNNKEAFILLHSYYPSIKSEVLYSLYNNKNKSFNYSVLKSLSEKAVSEFSNEDRQLILNHILKNYDQKQIEGLFLFPISNIINNISDENIDLIYKSVFIGKKSMVWKVNFLLDKLKMINENTVSQLKVLPKNQITGIINETKILNYFSLNDFLILKSIGLKKQSDVILNKANIIYNVVIPAKYIEENLFNFNFKSINIEVYFSIINKSIGFSNNFFDNLASNISKSEDSVNIMRKITKNINSTQFKEQFYLSLFSTCLNQKSAVGNILSKHEGLIKAYFFNNMNYDNINISNLSFFKECLEKLDNSSKILLMSNFLISKNIQTKDIVEIIKESGLDKNEEISYDFLDNNNYDMSYKNLILEFLNTNNIKNIISSLNKEFINNSINIEQLEYIPVDIYNKHSDLKTLEQVFINNSYIILNNFDLLQRFKVLENNSVSVLNKVITTGNFNGLESFFNLSFIDVNQLDFSGYFNSSINESNSNDFFIFLKNKQYEFSNDKLNDICNILYHWAKSNDLTSKENNNYINKFTESIENRLMDVDNNILVNICSIVFNNDKKDSYYNTKIFKDDLNNLLSVVFKEKNEDFFDKLNNESYLSDKNHEISEENMRYISYHKLNKMITANQYKETKKIKI